MSRADKFFYGALVAFVLSSIAMAAAEVWAVAQL